MKYRGLMIVALLALTAFIGAAWAAELTAYQIAKKSLELENQPNKTSVYKMTVINKKGQQRVYKFKAWQKETKDGSKRLLRFFEPADNKGIGLLSHEKKGGDLQWLFLPSYKKARQIASAEKSDQFMGSDLYYEDMGSKPVDDFEHALLQKVVLEGKECYLLESKPKAGVNTSYGKTRTWVDTTTFVAQKMELYDKKQNLLKTIYVRDAQLIDGIWTIKKYEAISVNADKAKTLIEMESVDYKTNIPDNYLTVNFLETDY